MGTRIPIPTPVPRKPPHASAETVACCQRALAMLRPPHMAPVRRFLLVHDPVVDLGILSNPAAAMHASIISSERVLAASNTALAITAIRGPFLNIGTFSVGVICARVDLGARLPAGGGGRRAVAGGGAATRAMTLGRYCRDDRTGKLLEFVRDGFGPDNWRTVSTIWYEGRSAASGLQERLDIVCDAALFAVGPFVDSVISFQRSVKKTLTPVSLPPILSNGPHDFTHQARNAACGHTGRWLDFCVKNLVGFTRNSMVPVRQRDVQGMIPAVLSVMYPCDDLSPATAAVRLCLMQTAMQFAMNMPHPMLGLSVVVDTYRAAFFVFKSRIISHGQEAFSLLLAYQSIPCPETCPASASLAAMPIGRTGDPSQLSNSMDLDGLGHHSSLDLEPMGEEEIDWSLVEDVDHIPSPDSWKVGTPVGAQCPLAAIEAPPIRYFLADAATAVPPADAILAGVRWSEWLQKQKKSRRRADNIAAAKRSNAKRKAAYQTLDSNVGVIKALEKLLRKRQEDLVAENKELREDLQSRTS